MSDQARGLVFINAVREIFGEVAFIFIVQDNNDPSRSGIFSNVDNFGVIEALRNAANEMENQNSDNDTD